MYKVFAFLRNDISNIILQETCSVLNNDNSFSQVNFFGYFLSIRNCFINFNFYVNFNLNYVLFELIVMNIFESLVVLRWLNTVLAVCENISFTKS